jgi:hypothetical protein
MSHISKIELQINDLDTLRAACLCLGLEFRPDQKTFEWYGGRRECHHVIRVPEASYEIGVFRNDENGSYHLQWDSYHAGGLEKKLGIGAGRLKQAYGIEKVRAEARRKGYHVSEQKTNQGIRLVLRL